MDFLPKNIREIFELHPDKLAKYSITTGQGGHSDFEKFLTFGVDFLNKYVDFSFLPWINSNQTMTGDYGALDASKYHEIGENHIGLPFSGANDEHEERLLAPQSNALMYELMDEQRDSVTGKLTGVAKPFRRTGDDIHFPESPTATNLEIPEIGYVHGTDLTEMLGDSYERYGTTEDKMNLMEDIERRFNILIKETTARVNTVLEERSFLDFYFPNPNVGLRRVALWENADITETRAPSYARQPIVQRNEPARLYVGSEPRKINMRFNYTLPLVEEFMYKNNNKPRGWMEDHGGPLAPGGLVGLFVSGGEDTVRMEYMQWIQKTLLQQLGPESQLTTGAVGDQWQFKNTSGLQGPSVWDDSVNPPERKVGMSTPKNVKGPDPMMLNSWSTDGDTMVGPQMEAIAYTHFVIDTIRAGVIGDHSDENTTYGPPIVRFRHGTLFTENPFILTNYNIAFSPNAGMDVRTLLPRQIRFTLELEEFHQTTGAQHGDFNEPLPGSSDIFDLLNPVRNTERQL